MTLVGQRSSVARHLSFPRRRARARNEAIHVRSLRMSARGPCRLSNALTYNEDRQHKSTVGIWKRSMRVAHRQGFIQAFFIHTGCKESLYRLHLRRFLPSATRLALSARCDHSWLGGPRNSKCFRTNRLRPVSSNPLPRRRAASRLCRQACFSSSPSCRRSPQSYVLPARPPERAPHDAVVTLPAKTARGGADGGAWLKPAPPTTVSFALSPGCSASASAIKIFACSAKHDDVNKSTTSRRRPADERAPAHEALLSPASRVQM